MRESEVRIVNPLGLHARAAAQLVRAAGRFRCRITIARRDTEASADAKSMLDVLTLAAAYNSELLLRADGEDEAAAVDALKKLFAEGFGEIRTR